MTTKETREVLAAVAAVSIRYNKAMEDGHLSKFELLKFVLDMEPIQRAMENIHLVPAEMINFSAQETEEVAQEVSVILSGWGVSHRYRDILSITSRRIPFIVDLLKALFAEFGLLIDSIRELPPTAEPV